MIRAIEDGLYQPSMKARMAELEAEKAILEARLAAAPLTPKIDGGLDVQLYGDLARILQFCEAGERTSQRPGRGGPGRGLSVVAGGGFEPPTFRL
jgi:hypothetical protein